jgi:cytochrome c5
LDRVENTSLAIIMGCPLRVFRGRVQQPDRPRSATFEETMSDHAHDAHTGPIKTPAQLMWTSFFFFVAPIFIIIGLVYFVTSGNKPNAGEVDRELATAVRIQRIGAVELRDANRPLAAGDAVYAAQCVACHAAGLVGAPKFGDAAAWGPRLGQGYETLLLHSLKGLGAMGAQGGGAYSDIEIGRAVVHMANAAGGKFPVPEAPAAEGAAAPAETAAAVTEPAPVQIAAAPAAPVAAAPAAVVTVAAGAGAELYKQACTVCHAVGVAGAPKSGDKAAWASRVGLGVDALTASVIKGKGVMPARGGSSGSDAEIKAAVEYMLAQLK